MYGTEARLTGTPDGDANRKVLSQERDLGRLPNDGMYVYMRAINWCGRVSQYTCAFNWGGHACVYLHTPPACASAHPTVAASVRQQRAWWHRPCRAHTSCLALLLVLKLRMLALVSQTLG